MLNLFPPQPSHVPPDITDPSPEFKKEVVKVLFLCMLFFLVYPALLLLTVGIAFLFGYLGVLLVTEVQGSLTLMLAIGAIGMGVMLIYFMLRALVFKKTPPIATVGEITESSEPLFFEFIGKVCEEAKAPFPKKIFLVDDVNAFVSYDSVFRSLFFPARKNLYIGLGLINSSTVSELKAVIAHEFGHFSQGSMRFGSYVYHFNAIIYKMVADNEGYNNSLQKWASFSSYFALFTQVNIGLIRAIQWLMRSFYKVLNKSYMGLARQMEFHADAVAASVAGSAPLITNLNRLELAKASYDHLLGYYNDLVKENIKADNLYSHHFKLMQLLAERENVQFKDDFPIIDPETVDRLKTSSIVVKDQWASHPSDEDRVAALKKLGIQSETVDVSAWELFADGKSLQVKHSDRIYESVVFEGDTTSLSLEEFELRYKDFLRLKSFNPEYKGYYNNRFVLRFGLQPAGYLPEDLSLAELVSDEYLLIPRSVARIEGDIAILDAIAAPESDYKSFDFEGRRYPAEDAMLIKAHLEKELVLMKEDLKKHDQDIYFIAYRNASSSELAADIEKAFQKMFDLVDQADKDISLYSELYQAVAPAYSQLPIEEIKPLVIQIIKKEKELKARIAELLADQSVTQNQSFHEDLELLRALSASNHLFFNQGKYLNNELELLNSGASAFLNISTAYCFQVKKEALDLQLNLLLKGEASNAEQKLKAAEVVREQ